MSLPDLARFYHPDATENASLTLDPEEGKHARVLRVRDGDRVHVINGKGQLFEAVARLGKKQTDVEDLQEVDAAQRSATITLAVAPTKNTNRFEWIIEKAIEIGADWIVPVITEHSERTHLRSDRLERIALSAVKQSKALWLTSIDEPKKLEDVLKTEASHRYIAHCHDERKKVSIHAITNIAADATVCLLIGPEGDFSPNEIDQAESVGWIGLDLGPKRLRTETAAIAVVLVAGLMRR